MSAQPATSIADRRGAEWTDSPSLNRERRGFSPRPRPSVRKVVRGGVQIYLCIRRRIIRITV